MIVSFPFTHRAITASAQAIYRSSPEQTTTSLAELDLAPTDPSSPIRRPPPADRGISHESRGPPTASSSPQISISSDSMDEPPSYDEARNRNLSAQLPSDVPSLHAPSIIEPHRSSHDAGPSTFDVPDIMPTLSMLGPPTELFPDAAPYFLMLTCTGPVAKLSGSHQPSLRLIAEYFKKWGRLALARPGMPASSGTPLLEVKIFGSRFSQGDYVDVALITSKFAQNEKQLKVMEINPAMIIGFIQGVLGYRIIHIGQDVWQFQRDKVFLVLN